MIRLSICLALALAGCAGNPEPRADTMRTASGVPVVSTSASPVDSASLRAGFGIIQSISLVNPPESAAAGGTAPVARGPYRISLRMDDGSTQSMVVDNRAFLVGDRVQVMPDGKLIRA
jgi:outer membrane lipoprotein SlyB